MVMLKGLQNWHSLYFMYNIGFVDNSKVTYTHTYCNEHTYLYLSFLQIQNRLVKTKVCLKSTASINQSVVIWCDLFTLNMSLILLFRNSEIKFWQFFLWFFFFYSRFHSTHARCFYQLLLLLVMRSRVKLNTDSNL